LVPNCDRGTTGLHSSAHVVPVGHGLGDEDIRRQQYRWHSMGKRRSTRRPGLRRRYSPNGQYMERHDEAHRKDLDGSWNYLTTNQCRQNQVDDSRTHGRSTADHSGGQTSGVNRRVQFCYLGSVISDNSSRDKDTRIRVKKANSVFGRLNNIWKSKTLSEHKN